MKKIKVGIIGCGFIGTFKHLPSIDHEEDVEVVAFCDLILERAQNAANKFGGPEALVCEDYQKLLDRKDIDVIHVCTPNNSHAEITIAALDNGKHVMCEKPMAKTGAEARAMLAAARENGKYLTIGYQNRFREDSLFMKKLCEKGELGDIYFAKAFATRRRGVPTWGVFLDKEKQGGGPLIDLATHALDLTLWMMNNYEPDYVVGTTFDRIAKLGSEANAMGPWNPKEYEVEDSAFGFIKLKNGATIMLESSWALNMIVSNEAMTMLCGTKAGADMFPPTGPVVRTSDLQSAHNYQVRVNGESSGKLFVNNYAMGESFIGSSDKTEDFAGAFKEMHAWFNTIRNDADLVVKPEQACVVTEILEAIYKSAQSGELIRMS